MQQPSTIIIDPTTRTDASRRVAERHAAQAPVAVAEVSQAPFIAWDKIAITLKALNRRVSYTSLPDSKVAIGLEAPPKVEIDAWENNGLSPWERALVRHQTGHQGPRPFIVAASMGFVAPYTRIMASDTPQVVCRSLKEICTRLVGAGAFTWDAAERAFGIRFRGPGTEIQVKHVAVMPRIWSEERPRLELHSDEPATPDAPAEVSL